MSILSEQKTVRVKLNDGRETDIPIAKLSISKLRKVLHAITRDDTFTLIELCTGWTEEWVDNNLEPEELSKISAACYEVNFRRAVELAKGDVVLAAKVVPLLAKLQGMTESIGALSSALSIEQQQSASAEATPTQSSTDSPSTT